MAAALIACQPATAQTNRASIQLDQDAQDIVDRITIERAQSLALIQQLANERERELLGQLSSQDRTLRLALSSADMGRGARDEARQALAAVMARRQSTLDQIARRERRFAADIAAFRRQIAAIAGSPNPLKRTALARYAEGDRAGALDILAEIQSAETAAAIDGWRVAAAYALEAYQHGEMARVDAIDAIQEAASVVETDRSLWLSLAALLSAAGRSEEAALAEARAAALAANR